MKKNSVRTVIAFLLLIISCTGSDHLFTVPDYKGWKKPVPEVLDYPVPGHGATYRVIYANEQAMSSYMKKGSRGEDSLYVPDGAVLVKEVYGKRADVGKAVPELTIMVKDRQDARSLGGWLYYLVKPGEKPLLVQGRMCAGCHEAANERHPYFDENKKSLFRDFLFVPLTK